MRLANLAAGLLLASSLGAQTSNEIKVAPIGAIGPELISCPSAMDKVHWWLVKDCPAVDGPTLTKIINFTGEQMDAVEHCGEYGPWILDKQGNIMGKYRNPPCPKGRP